MRTSIRSGSWQRYPAGERSDGYDASARAGFAEQRQELLGDVDSAEVVDVEDLAEAGQRLNLHGQVLGDACVVDDGEEPSRLLDRDDGAGDRGAVGDVADHRHQRGDAQLAQRCGVRLLADGGVHGVAAAAQLLGGVPADAGRGAGDQDTACAVHGEGAREEGLEAHRQRREHGHQHSEVGAEEAHRGEKRCFRALSCSRSSARDA